MSDHKSKHVNLPFLKKNEEGGGPYLYISDDNDGSRPWFSAAVHLFGADSVSGSASWSLFPDKRYRFGCGFSAGRNGGDSDIGLDLYFGFLGSLWLRLKSPWTKWARVSEEKDPKGWYNARQTGLRLLPHEGSLVSWNFDTYQNHWSRSDPWWRRWSLNVSDIIGKTDCEVVKGEIGLTIVPMPEGDYPAAWTKETMTWRYKRWPGKLHDVAVGPRCRVSYDLEIPGGIPIEGKGENSYDCGMDGLFGCSGDSLSGAIANAARSVTADRFRYGGPHDLTRPTTVAETERHYEVGALA